MSETPTQSTSVDNIIKVFPAKKFFVDSLTRDIDLADAILDLLDNCVDGARRKGLKQGDQPYTGYTAQISFTKERFTIIDNCGGIALEDAKECAFKFGRPPELSNRADGTIGVIGIGMKRAILKLGKSSKVHSCHHANTFEVNISPDWLKTEDWDLHFEMTKPLLPNFGTMILVEDLNESVQDQFDSKLFQKKLWEKIVGAFALLISRGFEVKINGRIVDSKMPTLLWEAPNNDSPVIHPYIYRDEIDGVEVYIAVGFRQPDKITTEEEDTRSYYSTEPAGWTIACNDRVVLFCDKTESTGWGTGRVPEYHTQFIQISGFAEFRAKDSSKLPFTTTKHGVNHQSKVFLKVFDKIREGTKLFTDWTNEFKEHNTQKLEIFAETKARSVSVEEIKLVGPQPLSVSGARNPQPFTFKPKLPKARPERVEKTIAFKRPTHEVEKVSDYLFGNSSEKASRVGEKCFDMILSKTQK